MDIKGLRFFLGVLRHKSITKAADHLYIAQPALGLQIRKLEAELGTQLMQRHSRGITPTEAGLLLAKHAEIILRQVERARQDLLDYAKTPRGRVTVGMSPTASQLLATGLARRIRDNYPEIVLNITEGLSEQLMEWVEQERIDIALTYNPTLAGDTVTVERLVEEVLYFIYPVGHSAAGKGPITLAQALRHPMVLPSRPHLLRIMVDEAAKDVRPDYTIAFEVDSVAMIRDFVRQGFGCTILPFGAVRSEVEEGRIAAREMITPEIARTLYLAFSNVRPPSKAFLAVTELVQGVALDLADKGTAGWRKPQAA